MAKWIPTILAALLAALTAAVPDVQSVVTNNPVMSSLLLAVLAIVTALAKSPLGQKKSTELPK